MFATLDAARVKRKEAFDLVYPYIKIEGTNKPKIFEVIHVPIRLEPENWQTCKDEMQHRANC